MALEREVEHRRVLSRYLVHDLRGVLAGLSGTLDYLRAISPGTCIETDSEIADCMNDVNVASVMLARMIGDLYDVEHVASEELPVQVGELDIVATVREIAETRLRIERAKGLKLELSVSPELSDKATNVVVSDKGLVERVVWDLLDNACRYAPAATVVRVEVSAVEGAIQIAVTDTGGAMPVEHCADAFERDYRIWGKEKGGRPGRAVALPFVRLALERLGGTCAAEPAPPNGTRFLISLPRTADLRGQPA